MIISSDSANKPVRELASEVLLKVETRRAYADILIDHALKNSAMIDPDRALLTEIVYGTLRWRAKIDALLVRCIRGSLANTEPFIRNLLRATLYQLCYLDKVPDYAAVSEAVEIAKRRGGRGIGSFVNAVLRSFLRDGKGSAKLPAGRETDCVPEVATEYSHPEWLVKRWIGQFGANGAKELMAANNRRPRLILRVNTLRTDRETFLRLLAKHNISAVPTEYSLDGVWVQDGGFVDKLPGFEDGLFIIQGEASQLIGYLVAPVEGELILDGCAAPGGKATHLAQLSKDRAEIIAIDISARGIEKIRQNSARLHLRSVQAHCGDLSQPLPDSWVGPYDKILLDAPCSGFGTLRAHPEIKWQRNNTDVLRLSRLQTLLLERAADYVKKDGVIIYSTCTLMSEENEKLIQSFLSRRKDFLLEPAASYLPKLAKQMIRNDCLLALPNRHATDGFFAARLRKVN